MRDTLKSVSGVQHVDVDFQRALATFMLDTKQNSPQAVAEQLSKRTSGRYQAKVVVKQK